MTERWHSWDMLAEQYRRDCVVYFDLLMVRVRQLEDLQPGSGVLLLRQSAANWLVLAQQIEGKEPR